MMRKFRATDLGLLSFLMFPALGFLWSLNWPIEPVTTDDHFTNAVESVMLDYDFRLWCGSLILIFSGACLGILLIQFLNRKSHMTEERLDKIALLEAEIELLDGLPTTKAYTGSLDNIKQDDYVSKQDVLKLIQEKEKALYNAKNKSL